LEIFDITPTINSRLAVFPGDTPFSEDFVMSTDLGQHLTLSKITTTVHLGAHTDAPIHYAARAESIESRSLHYYLGPAQVIEVLLPRGSRLRVADLKQVAIQAPRVLFRTGSYPDPYQWNNDFNALSSELVDYLHAKKVILVGIDTPSIDPAEDSVLESHQAIHRHNMAILEGIVLNQVPEGVYELIALPLKIEGADATPVRAILRTLPEARP
jgi:arylformamidase